MELYQLRYFSRAAKYESVSKAAADLHVSQPALSKSISKLEAEMGVELFDRTGKRFVLTDSGRYFQRRIDQIIRDLEDGVEATRQMGDDIEENIVVGVFGPQRPALRCIEGYMRANPTVQVTMRSKQQFKTQPIMHEFDCVFYPAGSSFDSLSGKPYARTSMKVIAPRNHPLARNDTVKVEDLRNEAFILLESTSGILERSYKMCQNAGFYPNVRAIVTSRIAQAYLVSAGHGIGLTDGLVTEGNLEDYAIIDLESDVPEQDLCVAFRPEASLSPAALRFTEFTQSFFGLE